MFRKKACKCLRRIVLCHVLCVVECESHEREESFSVFLRSESFDIILLASWESFGNQRVQKMRLVAFNTVP